MEDVEMIQVNSIKNRLQELESQTRISGTISTIASLKKDLKYALSVIADLEKENNDLQFVNPDCWREIAYTKANIKFVNSQYEVAVKGLIHCANLNNWGASEYARQVLASLGITVENKA